MNHVEQRAEIRGIVADTHTSDEGVSRTIQRLLGGVLGTTDTYGRSCLMLMMDYETHDDLYPRAIRVTEALLRAAEEQGLLRNLLAIMDRDGGDNIFHFHFRRSVAHLRILLEALDRLVGLCAAGAPTITEVTFHKR